MTKSASKGKRGSPKRSLSVSAEPASGIPGKTYNGKITTTGTSEAFRFDKSLFKQHPEFKQKAEVRADVIGPGTLLVSIVDKSENDTEDDPVVSAFLAFLANDMTKNPDQISSISAEKIAHAKSLTADVIVSDDDLE